MRLVYTLTSLLTVILYAAGCGEAVGPAKNPWSVLYTLNTPNAISRAHLASDNDTIYFVDEGENGEVVIKGFRYGSAVTSYEINAYGASAVYVYAIDINGPNGWAVGMRRYYSNGAESDVVPFLLKYEGKMWREVAPVHWPDATFFTQIKTIDAKSFWLVGYIGNPPSTNTLMKYDDGTFTVYPSIEPGDVEYDPDTGTTYISVIAKGELSLLITPNGGLTWIAEKPLFEIPNPDFRASSAVMDATSEACYIAINDSGRFPSSTVLLVRTGSLDAGTYSLLAYCPEGPYFVDAADVGADTTDDVILVGPKTSFFYDGSIGLLEELPDKNDFISVLPQNFGFYALAYNGMSMPRRTELLYHP